MCVLKLSIIVPVYNSERYLGSCLNSLAMLEDDDVEFILVNDGSKDNSLNICNKYSGLDSRFIVIDKINGGVSSARNAGLDVAKGEYIYFLDSDDLLSSSILQAVSYCNVYNIDYLLLKRFYLSRKCDEFKYNLHSRNFEMIDDKLYLIKDYVKLLHVKFFVSGSGEILFKSSCVQGVRFNETLSLLEDFDFFFMLFSANHSSLFLYDEIVTYIDDDNLSSLTRKREKLNDLSLGTLLNNSFLQLHDRLGRKIIWLEMYFYYKKITFIDRWKYLFKFNAIIRKNLFFCRYTIGVICLLLFNLDMNRIRDVFHYYIKKHLEN